jgi:hypothetical protein
LIVSDRKFDSDDEGQIFHLDFPLDVGELCHRVQTIIDRNDRTKRENNRLNDSIESN